MSAVADNENLQDKKLDVMADEEILVYIIEWMTVSIKHEINFGSFGPYTRIKRAMLLTATMPSYLKILKIFKKIGMPCKKADFHRCVFQLKANFINADEQKSKHILTFRFDGLGWSVKWHDRQYYDQYRGYKDYISKKNKGMDIREIGPEQIPS